ncbi:hypothetical protein ABMY26_25270 [Azospirillum sp. HJ39]|uniref:hypothetical protein n=1 Tax=Azospirillum sp. HJ39 TaxID=3159496 RepID=UPI00355632EF
MSSYKGGQIVEKSVIEYVHPNTPANVCALIIEKDFPDEMVRRCPRRRADRHGSRPNDVSWNGAVKVGLGALPMVPPGFRDSRPFLRPNAMPDGSRLEPAADAGAP